MFLPRTQHHQVWLQLQIVRNAEREKKVLQFAKASHRLLKIEANLNYLSKSNLVDTYLSVQSHSAPSCRNHLVKLAWMAWCRANSSFTLCWLNISKKSTKKLKPKLRRPPPQDQHKIICYKLITECSSCTLELLDRDGLALDRERDRDLLKPAWWENSRFFVIAIYKKLNLLIKLQKLVRKKHRTSSHRSVETLELLVFLTLA